MFWQMYVTKIYEVAGRRKYVNGIYKRSKTAAEKLEIDAINAVKCVMMGKYSTRPVWGKLYKRDIIEKNSFDEEHIFEEVRYSVDTFLAAKKVVMADRDLYSYCLREGSIITSDANRRIKDLTLAFEYVFNKLNEKELLLILRILKLGILPEITPLWSFGNDFSSFQAVC